MTKWEYKVERFDQMHGGSHYALENVLNERGGEGWDFLGVQLIPVQGSSDLPYAIFKRQA
jgi:hypothetical protein